MQLCLMRTRLKITSFVWERVFTSRHSMNWSGYNITQQIIGNVYRDDCIQIYHRGLEYWKYLSFSDTMN
jgi:hypothetical protein